MDKKIEQALSGDKTALTELLMTVQDDVYYLALRMLVNAADAQDATQEILLKVVVNLSTFKANSHFKTWVYRIAVNYLLSAKKLLNKHVGLNFEMYKADLEHGLQDPGELKNAPEYPIMLNELRIACTMAMLLCLKPALRMAYILGDILELDHREASEILDTTKAAFRQQLSRSRAKIIDFMTDGCGLVNQNAACQCPKRISQAVALKRVRVDCLDFAKQSLYSYHEIQQRLTETQEDLRALSVQKAIQHYKSPLELSAVFESLLAGKV